MLGDLYHVDQVLLRDPAEHGQAIVRRQRPLSDVGTAVVLFDQPGGVEAQTLADEQSNRAATDEGAGSAFGQVADLTLLEVGSRTFIWHAASPDGRVPDAHQHIKLAVAQKTLAQLVATSEGG